MRPLLPFLADLDPSRSTLNREAKAGIRLSLLQCIQPFRGGLSGRHSKRPGQIYPPNTRVNVAPPYQQGRSTLLGRYRLVWLQSIAPGRHLPLDLLGLR